MITYRVGNILESDAEALVNTVNTVGVMGKGIALQFKKAYPENYKKYKLAVDQNEVQLGKMFVTETNRLIGPKYIINFPTKGHWRYPSKLKWIKDGLQDLKRVIREKEIKSVAVPPLGCGQGGLDWKDVKREIENTLSGVDAEIIAYEPSEKVKEILKKQERKKEANLTPVRAMLLYLLFHYRSAGEFATEFAAEKLSYFLQRLGEKQLKLNFKKGYYGPYSGKVRHVLYAINGTYLFGYEGKDLKPFEPFQLNTKKFEEIKKYIETLGPAEKQRLENVLDLISGFETPFALELLSTVDFITQDKKSISVNDVLEEAQSWSDRKRKLLNEKNIKIAAEQLKNFVNNEISLQV
jgi:O-acetyl-ADP-ribose deacetylase (regulator of RNase III)